MHMLDSTACVWALNGHGNEWDAPHDTLHKTVCSILQGSIRKGQDAACRGSTIVAMHMHQLHRRSR